MDDKTINLQEYKENKRQASIEAQKQWEEGYKEAVMNLAHSTDVPATRLSTADSDAVTKVLQGEMPGTIITENRCVCCGKEIVEGRMVCEDCEQSILSSPARPLPKKTWERSYEERFGEKKSSGGGLRWIKRLFFRD